MIPQSDPDQTAYLSALLRTEKSERQNNTFLFPTPENPGKSEDHTPIQTRTVKGLVELKKKEKLNPQENTESQNKQMPQTIRLDRYTSNGNRGGSN